MLVVRAALLVMSLWGVVTPCDGIGIDPNGGGKGTSLDHRCTIDPNGSGCTANATLDRGAGLDPDGGRQFR